MAELDFMSEDWLNALSERLKTSDAYKKAAKGWRSSMAPAAFSRAVDAKFAASPRTRWRACPTWSFRVGEAGWRSVSGSTPGACDPSSG